MKYVPRLAAVAVASTLALACGDDGGGGPDAATPDETLQLTGLDGSVDVTVDDRGVPHIRGTTVHDVLLAEGYLMARDRFAQMEFIRRSVTGRLAEVAGALSPGLIEDDRAQRLLGFKRVGQQIYDGLSPTDPTRLAADAFVAGVNQYIDRVLKQPGYQTTRGNEALALILSSPFADHWTGADVFALARYQSWNLSYDAGADVARTQARAGVTAAFPAGIALAETKMGALRRPSHNCRARSMGRISSCPCPCWPYPAWRPGRVWASARWRRRSWRRSPCRGGTTARTAAACPSPAPSARRPTSPTLP